MNENILEKIFTNKFNEIEFIKFLINMLNLEKEDILNGMKIEEENSIYKNHIEYIKDIGSYVDDERNTIVASIVKLNKSVEKARTLQRNFIGKHLKDLNVDAAIVALYCDDYDTWRISFVKLDTDFKLDKSSGIYKIEETFTSAKRYSYLVEPTIKNHTVQEQLKKLFDNDIKKPSLKEIENVFSVEVVTDEFFKIYKEKYLQLKELLENDEDFIKEAKRINDSTRDSNDNSEITDLAEEFAKKLMGQIAFLYFLQKKGWLGARIVPKEIPREELREILRSQNEDARNLIKEVYKGKNEKYVAIDGKKIKSLSDEDADLLAGIFKNSKYDEEWGKGTKVFIRETFEVAKKSNKNFFNEYLEQLFYNALNKKRGNNEYFKKFNCKIPFLNGGLFEPMYRYDWENTNINIPNEFFSNEDKNGLLDFFDLYNFTMNEDEPLEKEVAVDPEMLGKIFENLLDIKERKSKGAFYTPREIVHYMCQECLINYLHTKTGIDLTSLELFIKYGDILKDADLNIKNKDDLKMPKFIINKLEELDNALENVKVVDPAVGSGAFPLGMLNELVRARATILDYETKDMAEWEKEDFIIENKRSMYDFKKTAMKKSIFAVDIEPSAVDITKLRLWLSLVVDADTKTINTLPNLDYNIMVGNSLVEEFNGVKLFDEELLNKKNNKKNNKKISNQVQMNLENGEVTFGMEQTELLIEEIQSLQSKLFDEKDPSEKIKIKRDIEDKEWDLIEYKLTKDNELLRKDLEELKKWRNLNRRPYFLWKLEFNKIFQQNGGFDIVIGNPPYIGEKENKEKFHEIKETEFGKKFYQRRMDYFYFFIGKGIEILKEKGYLGFITTNYWVTATGGQKYLRPYLKENTNIKKYVNFGEYKIFKSAQGQHNCIFILEKNIKEKKSKAHIIEVKDIKKAMKYSIDEILKEKKNLDGVENYFSQEQNELYEEGTYNIRFNDKNTKYILDKIIRNSNVKINDICTVSGGISSSADKVTKANIKHCTDEEIIRNNIKIGNGILLLNEKELADLDLNKEELRYIKPLFKSTDIKAYKTDNKTKKYLIYATHNNAKEIKKCEKIYSHLKKYESILKNRSRDIELELAMSKGYWFVLTNGRNKIDFNGEKIVCPYRSKDNNFGYNNEIWYGARDIYFLVGFKENIKYILGILNSKLIKFWLKNKGKMKGDLFEFYPEPLKNIPIIINNYEIKEEIVLRVNKILEEDDIINKEKLINEINNLVYKLYGITNKEIEYIEKKI